MDMTNDELKELIFDYNSAYLLDLYEDVKATAETTGYMSGSKSTEFIGIIMECLTFHKTIPDDDDDMLSD